MANKDRSLSHDELEHISNKVVDEVVQTLARLAASGKITTADGGYVCEEAFGCFKKYSCIAPHECKKIYAEPKDPR